MNDEAFMTVHGFGERHFCQAVSAAAICACEMWVALCFGAIMGEFKVSRPVFYECFVDEARF